MEPERIILLTALAVVTASAFAMAIVFTYLDSKDSDDEK